MYFEDDGTDGDVMDGEMIDEFVEVPSDASVDDIQVADVAPTTS